MYPYFSRDRILSDLRLQGGAIRKSLGQNFLIDPNTIDRMLRHVSTVLDSSLSENASAGSIIEIGPGLGAMTHRLLALAPVTALELDPMLCELLRRQFSADERFTLIEGDARRTLAGLSAPILCGNLPYYITTELILEGLQVQSVRHLFFLVQTEFARRACAKTAESSFTVYLRNFGRVEMLERISASCFFPSPSVESSFFAVHRHPVHASPDVLEKLLRMSYRGKRKKIRNSWRIGEALLPVERLEDLAASVGIDTELRPEQIEIDAYHRFAAKLAESSLPDP